MTEMQYMQNIEMQNAKHEITKQTYQTIRTKVKPPNETYQTKLTKPNLPNQTYQTKPTKPNLLRQTYQTKKYQKNLLKPTFQIKLTWNCFYRFLIVIIGSSSTLTAI